MWRFDSNRHRQLNWGMCVQILAAPAPGSNDAARLAGQATSTLDAEILVSGNDLIPFNSAKEQAVANSVKAILANYTTVVSVNGATVSSASLVHWQSCNRRLWRTASLALSAWRVEAKPAVYHWQCAPSFLPSFSLPPLSLLSCSSSLLLSLPSFFSSFFLLSIRVCICLMACCAGVSALIATPGHQKERLILWDMRSSLIYPEIA